MASTKKIIVKGLDGANQEVDIYAADSDKLGGQAPAYYAKQSDLDMVESDLISMTNDLQSDVEGKAPISHASTATTYGVGSSSNYGHVKVIDNLTQSSNLSGTALSAYQGKVLKDSLSDIEDKLFADYDTNRYTSFVGVPAKSGAYRIIGAGGAPNTSYSNWALLLLEAGASSATPSTKYFIRLAFYIGSTSATNYDMYYSKASHNGTSWSAGTWYKIWNEYNDSEAPFLLKTGGTMTGTLTANNSTTWTTGYVRNIKAGTAAPTTSTCPLGQIYLQYE